MSQARPPQQPPQPPQPPQPHRPQPSAADRLRAPRLPAPSLRLGLAGALAAALLAGALALPAGAGGRTTTLAASAELAKSAQGVPHDDSLLPAHDHGDPRTKNQLSRSGEPGAPEAEPVAADVRARAADGVAADRALPDPTLVPVDLTRPRAVVPEDRFAMAGGCYSLAAPDGRVVTREGRRLALGGAGAAAFYFKATRLGAYLLHTPDGEVGAGRDGAVAVLAKPGPSADWTTSGRAGVFTLTPVSGGGALTATADGRLVLGSGSAWSLRASGACPAYPEAEIGVTGDPHGGVTPFQEVRGYVDAHTHGMAFEFLGGKVHCGRPWHEYGAPYALVDCPDHTLTGGKGALLEAALSGEVAHDPVGWPTFRDWPAPESLTHEGTYWRWMERSWRGGQRLLVNLLVENNQLCRLYPLKRNSCDDMDSIRLQARDMHALQDYVDAQYGGPGRGFYRIVRDPAEARRVINGGRMAVVMGIETSVPFGCTYKRVLGRDRPACTTEQIDAQLDEMRDLGVRQMELVNKFDNALAGVAGDAGPVGVAVNAANFLETGSFWSMEHCEPADGESADNPQLGVLPNLPGLTAPARAPGAPAAGQQDALFGVLGTLLSPVTALLPGLPLYGTPAHCNRRGLTGLGEHTIAGLAKRRMIFDPDHLSVRARSASMDLIERLGYPGVISSHSWSTPDTYPRIYRAGGFITPYAGDSTGFVEKWRRHVGWADPRYYFGIGFGADINGLGAQGSPRGKDVANPVRYPFTGLGGVRIDRQRAGERVWDINVDGVAQYGLYPDWIEDLRQVAEAARPGDGARIVADMERGAEAYLQMWERAEGIAPDSCRNPERRRSVAEVRASVRQRMTGRAVLDVLGQPWQRLGSTYVFCARGADGARRPVDVVLDRAGRVASVEVD